MPRGPRPAATVPRPNRSDLATAIPISTVKGQTYGRAAEQQAAQRAIPMAPAQIAAGAPGGGSAGAPPPAPPGAAPTPPMPLAGANPLTRPTERPNEPITAGMPTGPGPGPEALTGFGQMAQGQTADQGTLATLLQHLSAQPGASSAIQDLASRAMGGVR